MPWAVRLPSWNDLLLRCEAACSPALLRRGMPRAKTGGVGEGNYYSEGRAALITEAVRQVKGEDPTPFERFLADHVAGFQ